MAKNVPNLMKTTNAKKKWKKRKNSQSEDYYLRSRKALRTSLVAQGLRIRLPIQGTWGRSLVREDLTCRRATKPMCHNYWSLRATTTEAHVPQQLKPACLEPVLRNKKSHHNEKATHRSKEWPLLAATGESPHAATKTQHSQKQN